MTVYIKFENRFYRNFTMYKNRLAPITQLSVIEQTTSKPEIKPTKILYDLTGVKKEFSNILDSFSNELNTITDELRTIEEANRNLLSFKNMNITNKYITAVNEHCHKEEQDMLNFLETFDYNNVENYDPLKEKLNLCRENFKKLQLSYSN